MAWRASVLSAEIVPTRAAWIGPTVIPSPPCPAGLVGALHAKRAGHPDGKPLGGRRTIVGASPMPTRRRTSIARFVVLLGAARWRGRFVSIAELCNREAHGRPVRLKCSMHVGLVLPSFRRAVPMGSLSGRAIRGRVRLLPTRRRTSTALVKPVSRGQTDGVASFGFECWNCANTSCSVRSLPR